MGVPHVPRPLQLLRAPLPRGLGAHGRHVPVRITRAGLHVLDASALFPPPMEFAPPLLERVRVLHGASIKTCAIYRGTCHALGCMC